MAAKKIRVIVFGLGSIGIAAARVLALRPEYQFVGAVDLDPSKVGQDLGGVLGVGQTAGVIISDKAEQVLKRKAEVVIHATGSYFKQVKPQLEMIVRAGHNIVSTCEELSDPWVQSAREAAALDRLAKKFAVTVVGTGINPGFAMDTLPATLTAACQTVTSVRVRRVVDASKRRMQLQRKIGTGMTPEEFAQKASARELRHVGLSESAALIARGLGWALDNVDEDIVPVLARKQIKTEFYSVEPGYVTGVKQTCRGWVNGEVKITLELEMAVDVRQPVDEAWIEGTPSLHSVVKGIHGDLSTAALVANTARRVVGAPPGVLTMVDLPLVSAQ